jgi:hypothetical protein
MMLKVLGLADIIAIVIFALNNFLDKTGWFSNKIVIIAGIYLLIKGFLFVINLDFASFIDMACGLILVISGFTAIPYLISIIVVVFLLQKALFSFLN